MRLICAYLIALIASCLLWGCSGSETSKISTQMICHSWKSNLEDSNMRGNQVITFDANNEFNERKVFIYFSTDSGFEFSIKCAVKTSGNWQLKQDTLLLKYNETVKVTPIADSFTVSYISKSDSLIIDESIKTEMSKDICNFLNVNIPLQFSGIANKYYPLGTIKALVKDTMLLENNHNIITLVKINP